MIAAGATVSVVSSSGTAEIRVEDIPVGPGLTNLGTGEIITAVNLPKETSMKEIHLRFIPERDGYSCSGLRS